MTTVDEVTTDTTTEDTPAAPVGFGIKFGTPPKKSSNLQGREGIKWEELLSPLTENPHQPASVYEKSYTTDVEAKRAANLFSAKGQSIRERLEYAVPNEDWDVFVRTDRENSKVALWVVYHGELTPERRAEKQARKEKYTTRRAKAQTTQSDANGSEAVPSAVEGVDAATF